MARIYVASSWRHAYYRPVVSLLREDGHEVYDKEPTSAFRWTDVDDGTEPLTAERFRRMLGHPLSQLGFNSDMDALKWCEACLMVQPAGNRSHTELGWAAGARKITAVLYPYGIEPEALPKLIPQSLEPELMLKMAGGILINRAELLMWSRMLAQSLEKVQFFLAEELVQLPDQRP